MPRESTAKKAPVPRKRWHFIITIAWTDNGGVDRTAIETGTCAPPPTYSREDMQDVLYERIVQETGAEEAIILFFCLAANELS